MTSGGKAAASWRLLLLSLLFWAVVFAKDAPDVHATKVDNLPANLRYFEDSDSVLYLDISTRNILRSDDAGVSWKTAEDIPEGKAAVLIMHPYDRKTAFVLTETSTHYKTVNQGAKWSSFSSGALPSAFQPNILIFHADDKDRIIFNGMNCESIFCDEESTYTTDGFETVQLLRAFTAGCRWAKASPEFSTGDKDKDKTRTMCIVTDPFSFFKEDQRLHISDDYFDAVDNEIQEFEPDIDMNKGVSGVVNMAATKKHLLVATSSFLSDEMALFVTDDTIKWHRAMFPTDDSHDHSHQINQEAYTVLEGTNYSIQIDVMTSNPSNPMGVLFTSNSNGTYFTENVPYTNRNARGLVDFEQITGIQGVYLINIVENGPDVDRDGDEKVIVSKITFDDGRTFDSLKAGDDTLHLHSFTEPDNVGKVFSSSAPGLVMGNGNTGKSLGKFVDADLYVSDDAGVTWERALKGAHKYEFGDSGSVLVAIEDSTKADVGEFSYSLDHGDNWETVKLPDGLEIKPGVLTTTPDSTSLKFLLLGEKDDDFYIVAIDFDGLHERTCGDDDMETWHARVDEDGEETCIMGHKQTYRRRKKSADCFIKDEFHDPVPKSEDCECSDSDFECDYNFQRDEDDRSICKNVGPIATPEGECRGDSDTFRGSSGWRLIPGNTCKRTEGKQKDDEVERKCSDSTTPLPSPGSGEVSHTQYTFEDTKYKDFQKIYLERSGSSTQSDETIIVRPEEPDGDRILIENKLWLSNDHGKNWKRILEGEEIRQIYPHQNFKDVVYFGTDSRKVIYTIDRGHSFHSFEAPTSEGEGGLLTFHPERKDWLIWIAKDCDKIGGTESCHSVASVSTDRGDNWKTLLRYATKCVFTGQSAYKIKDRDLMQVVCAAREEESNDAPLTIMTSNDLFTEDKTVYKGSAIDFATMSEFIVLAGEDEDTGDLVALASMDGKHFEEAHFPYNFHAGHQSRYTVLDSSTHAVNLFVLVEGSKDQEYGSIVKSNSNGTSYVLSASNVNCNSQIYVDFEKVPGLEGVALINVVTNADTKEKTKKLQTKITHTDGTEWGYLAPPAKDVNGKSYKCSSSKGDKSCALHLHHYTERDDSRRTFAAQTAVGLMFGAGNVGATLGDIKDADTFMTADGGVTWMNVKKGHWTWQYGDQGSVIVLVQRATQYNQVKTNKVSFSLDEGKSWADYTFSADEVTVVDITTLRSGTSRNFLLWCRSDSGKVFSVNLDFTGLADKPCQLTDDSDSDYFTWSPKHPLQNDDCLFGHVAKYLRKKSDSKCYNELSLQRLYEYSNCDCSRRDYECAYNYELDNHGQCMLVQGLKPLSGAEWCQQHPNATTWFEPTGYRRVPLSTCQGGSELDKTSTEHPCTGYEEDFKKKHRTSGVAIFFAVVIPFALAGAIGWYVYRNWSGKVGEIRLGEDAATFDSSQPWVKYPLMVATGAVALLAAVPALASKLLQSVSGPGGGRSWFSTGPRRFTTRDSFTRGRGDYSVVDDEGELLGEDSDDEA